MTPVSRSGKPTRVGPKHTPGASLEHSGQGIYTRLLGGLLLLYLFIYVWSVPMLMLDLVPSWGRGMGGCLMILQGVLIGIWLVDVGGWRGGVAAVTLGALAYGVEYIGVRTGWPFGQYRYTPVLGLQLGGAVPLAIPFAWLTVVVGAWMLVGRSRSPAVAALMTAGFALLLDLLIEPVATGVTGYWQWITHGSYYGVPAANFVAWGGTALILSLLLYQLLPTLRQTTHRAWLPPLLVLLNVVQFTLVNAAYGFWWAALIGAGALAGSWLSRATPGFMSLSTAVRDVGLFLRPHSDRPSSS